MPHVWNALKHGLSEYVALEKLESVYSNIKFAMPNGVCCVADSEKNYPVALILVNKEVLMHTARTRGWAGSVGRGHLDSVFSVDHMIPMNTQFFQAFDELFFKKKLNQNAFGVQNEWYPCGQSSGCLTPHLPEGPHIFP